MYVDCTCVCRGGLEGEAMSGTCVCRGGLGGLGG